jgi:hypothetical protein
MVLRVVYGRKCRLSQKRGGYKIGPESLTYNMPLTTTNNIRYSLIDVDYGMIR